MREGPVSSWLLSNIDLIPRAGRALDVACGRGRHALFLAERGWAVRAVDRDALSIDVLRSEAARHGLTVQADVVDFTRRSPWTRRVAAGRAIPISCCGMGSCANVWPRWRSSASGTGPSKAGTSRP